MLRFEDFLRRALAEGEGWLADCEDDFADVEPVPVPDELRDRILAEARRIGSAGSSHPQSAERGGALSAQDNPPATDDGSHG